MRCRHPDLIYHDRDDTYTYRPTGERFPAMHLDDFARAKLESALDELARALVEVTNGRIWGLPD